MDNRSFTALLKATDRMDIRATDGRLVTVGYALSWPEDVSFELTDRAALKNLDTIRFELYRRFDEHMSMTAAQSKIVNS